jgi:very-short-patch-repair endonuclease
MPLPYSRNVTRIAKKLRNNPTEEENKLWYQYLSGYPVRFLRQKVIECYVLDFYCAKCRLGIEVDGTQHFTEEGLGYDEARTQLLNAYGVTILRFTNEQVRKEFGEVCKRIDAKVKELPTHFERQLSTRPYVAS